MLHLGSIQVHDRHSFAVFFASCSLCGQRKWCLISSLRRTYVVLLDVWLRSGAVCEIICRRVMQLGRTSVVLHPLQFVDPVKRRRSM